MHVHCGRTAMGLALSISEGEIARCTDVSGWQLSLWRLRAHLPPAAARPANRPPRPPPPPPLPRLPPPQLVGRPLPLPMPPQPMERLPLPRQAAPPAERAHLRLFRIRPRL